MKTLSDSDNQPADIALDANSNPTDASTHPTGEDQTEECTGTLKDVENRRKRYLVQLEAQHRADVQQMEYEKQIRQQQVREELEQRRKRYEQQNSQSNS